MAKLKNKKYIIEDFQVPAEEISKAAANPEKMARLRPIVRLGGDIIEGSFHVGFVWALKPSTMKHDTAAHTHDYNEVLGFLGSDWTKPRDLGAEIEFWLEDEKYILKNSCIIYVPKGMKHCPLKDLKIDRPFIHFGMFTKDK
jgi:FAD/FMN-containing dehydrogenase